MSEFETIDGNMIFQDEEVAYIIDFLKQRESLVTYIHSDGLLEYFDSPDDLKNSFLLENNIATKSVLENKITDSGILTVFEDSKCKGRELAFSINSYTPNIEIPHLGNKWNNKISSIDMVCSYHVSSDRYSSHGNGCIATFYDEENFSGNSIWFAVDPYFPHSYIHYFKSYPLYPGSSRNWNDRISSLRFSFDWWKS